MHYNTNIIDVGPTTNYNGGYHMKKRFTILMALAMVLVFTLACAAEEQPQYNFDGTVELTYKRFGGHIQVDRSLSIDEWNIETGLYWAVKPDFTLGAAIALPRLNMEALKTEKTLCFWSQYALAEGLTFKLTNTVPNTDFANSMYTLTARYDF